MPAAGLGHRRERSSSQSNAATVNSKPCCLGDGWCWHATISGSDRVSLTLTHDTRLAHILARTHDARSI